MSSFARTPKASQLAESPTSTTRNRAVFGDSRDAHAIEDKVPATGSLTRPRLTHDLSLISIHPKERATIQPKLTTSTPGDPCEQQAERIAEQVMRMTEPHLQRKSEPGEHVADGVQKLVTPPRSMLGNNKAASGGKPLPDSTRTFFETRFGYDFSHVRIHTEAEAARQAHNLNARAFTSGSDLVFAAGEYYPHSWSGRKLIAHELTHTIQQSRTSTPWIQRQEAGKKEPVFTFQFVGQVNKDTMSYAHTDAEGPIGIIKATTSVRAGKLAGNEHPLNLWRSIWHKTGALTKAQILWVKKADVSRLPSKKKAPKPTTDPPAEQEPNKIEYPPEWKEFIEQVRKGPATGSGEKSTASSWIPFVDQGGDVVKSLQISHMTDEERLKSLDQFLDETIGQKKKYEKQRIKAISYRLFLAERIEEKKRQEAEALAAQERAAIEAGDKPPPPKVSSPEKHHPGEIRVSIDYEEANNIPHIGTFSEDTYVDNKVIQVGVRLMDGMFALLVEGRQAQIGVQQGQIFRSGSRIALSDRVFRNREDAMKALGSRKDTHFAYWQESGGLIFPTHFMPSNAPRVVWFAKDAMRQAAALGTEVFSGFLWSIVAGKAFEVGAAKGMQAASRAGIRNAWNSPHLSEAEFIKLYRSSVSKETNLKRTDAWLRGKYRAGERYNPDTRTWSKPFKEQPIKKGKAAGSEKGKSVTDREKWLAHQKALIKWLEKKFGKEAVAQGQIKVAAYAPRQPFPGQPAKLGKSTEFIPDAVVRKPDGTIGLYDAKLEKGSLTGAQRIGSELLEQYGGVIISSTDKRFPVGTEIAPTKYKVMRPKDLK